MTGIFEIIDILFDIYDDGLTFESVEDCGNEILRRYKARNDAEQNDD